MFNNYNSQQATRKIENKGVVDKDIREYVIDLVYYIRNFINAFGLIFGSIALHLIDVILGGLVLSQMLAGSSFSVLDITIQGTTLGWLLSLVFWFVQLLLWDAVFQDGKLDLHDLPAIVIAVSIAVLDTFGDSSSVLLATKNSTLREFLQGETLFGYPLFNLLKQTLFYSVMIVTGGNEFINQLMTRNASGDLFKRIKVSANRTKTNPFFQKKPVKKSP